MTSRIRKAIERMLSKGVPTAPLSVKVIWFARANDVRFSQLPNRVALRRARKLLQEAEPIMSPYQAAQWLKL